MFLRWTQILIYTENKFLILFQEQASLPQIFQLKLRSFFILVLISTGKIRDIYQDLLPFQFSEDRSVFIDKLNALKTMTFSSKKLD